MEPIPSVTLKNFVCSASLGMKFNLSSIVTKVNSRGSKVKHNLHTNASHKLVEILPKKHCIVMKIPRIVLRTNNQGISRKAGTAMLFSTGKLVCTGASSEQEMKGFAKKVTQLIQTIGYPDVTLIDYKLHSVVGTCIAGFKIRLEHLALSAEHRKQCTYEPEVYPALLYRCTLFAVTIIVFSTGKIVFTDSKQPSDIEKACRYIFPILRVFTDEDIKK